MKPINFSDSKTSPTQDGLAKGEQKPSEVYFVKGISSDKLLQIYHAIGRKAHGRVAIKISTGEAGNPNYLKPALIKPLVDEVKGTIVECNTAYEGARYTTESHRQLIHEHGFDTIAKVDLMDEESDFEIPIKDGKHLRCDLVGSHIKNYDFMINLAHFKGHPMAGFGGVLKNQSIGIASSKGKSLIHSAGKEAEGYGPETPMDDFQESMAEAAKAVADYEGENILYIDVMNNMSIDCDCVSDPVPVELDDIGILGSLDPVALDKACLDLIAQAPEHQKESFEERVAERHGRNILTHAEKIGLGTQNYELIELS